MKTKMLISLLATPLAFAAPFEPKSIPAEASWFFHGDLTALREMESGKFLLEVIRAEQSAALTELESIFEFDPLTDLTDVVLFGNDREGEGAVILTGTLGRDHLEEVIAYADNYRTSTFGTTTVHHWDDEGTTQHAAFHGDRTVVITQQEKLLQLALEVLAGKKPGLATSPVPLSDHSAVVAYGNLRKIEMPDDEGSRIVRQAKTLGLSIGEKDQHLRIVLTADTQSPETAGRFAAVMEGLISLGELADERLASLGIQHESSTEGATMSMTMSLPVAKALEVLSELD
jgi:hypothetical protein